MEGGITNTGFIQLDFIEEGRKNIFEWREKRRTNRTGLRGRIYEITKLFIDRTLLRSFINNLSIVVGFQMLLGGFCTYVCVQLNLEFDVQMSLFVSPIVFPLAFSINANYQRRETVLEDLAMFKAASLILFFCHRDWVKAVGLPVDLLKALSNKLKFLIINIKEYLLTEDSGKRKFILQAVYEDFSDISQINDKLRVSELKSNSSLIARLVHCHNLMCWSFEKLRVIREYKSPRSLRSFTKVFIFFMPLLLSPYYVYRGQQTESYWAPYYISVLVSFLFGSLQAVQDKLDDPFDGIGEDDVNLQQLEEWTLQSLLTNRTVHVGRFTVTTTTGNQEEKSGNKSPIKTMFTQKDETTNVNKIASPKKKRRASTRKRDSCAEQMLDDKEFTNEMESRFHGIASKLEGLSGSTTIRPGSFLEKQKRSSSRPDVSERGTDEGSSDEEKMRYMIPRATNLAVVRETDEREGVGSTETSPVLNAVRSRKSFGRFDKVPEIAKLFASDTDTVTSDESDKELLGNTINVATDKLQTSYRQEQTAVLPEEDLPSGQMPLFVPAVETESDKKPSVMEMFGLNKGGKDSGGGKRVDSADINVPPLAEGEAEDVSSSLPSPVTSCEDIPEDTHDVEITDRLSTRDSEGRSQAATETEHRGLPKLKFSSGKRKRQPWSIPGSWSKWRKQRSKKSPVAKATEHSPETSENLTSASTSLLLSDESRREPESRPNESGGTQSELERTEKDGNGEPTPESEVDEGDLEFRTTNRTRGLTQPDVAAKSPRHVSRFTVSKR